MYMRGLGVIEAQEILRDAEVAAYPYGKQQTREKFYRNVRKLVVIQDGADKSPVPMEEFAAHLKGMVS